MIKASQYVAARYMVDFECIGDRCEDNCCGNWRIHVDEKHYKRLKSAMSARSPAERARFAAAFEVTPAAQRRRATFARLKLLPDGRCPMLDDRGWCTIHRDYGEPQLPDTCSAYPRSIALVGERAQLLGAVSCPEIARRLLLDEDALDLEEVAPSRFGRGVVKQTILLGEPDPYVSYSDSVKAAAIDLLRRGEYPIESRLFFTAFLGHRTAPIFHRGGEGFDEALLQGEIDSLHDQALVDELHRGLATTGPRPELTLEIVLGLLAARLGDSRNAFFRVVAAVMTDYAQGGVGPAVPREEQGVIPSPSLIAAWQARQAAWPRHLAWRYELYLRNYVHYLWLDDWYFAHHDLFVYVLQLLVRVAVLRFLLISHPAARAAFALDGEAAQVEALDKVAVEVFYTFSRAVEHTQAFIDSVVTALDRQGLVALPTAAALIKF